jgi:L-fuculose-phosphate aldolase
VRAEATRTELVARSRQLVADGLVVGTAGNLSVAVDDLIAMTPSSLPYADCTPGDIVLLDADGAVVDGDLLPTSEWQLHLAVHAARAPGAIVHTHSPFATAVSTVVDELPAIHYYVELLGGPVRVAPYATFGSRELADHVVTGLRDRSAVLMGNHGALTIGATLTEAYERARTLEWLCQVFVHARAAGQPRLLDPERLADVRTSFTRLLADRDAAPGWRNR